MAAKRQLPHGSGEVAHLARVDHAHRHALGLQRARKAALITACGLPLRGYAVCASRFGMRFAQSIP